MVATEGVRAGLGLLLGIQATLGMFFGAWPPDHRETGAGRAVLSGPLVSCADCHETVRGFSHPVGAVPSMKVPAHLPLDRGRLSCSTCHDDPEGQGHIGARRNAGSMLRGSPDPEGFCVQCHRGARSLRSRAHGTSFPRAHLLWPRSAPQRSAPVDPTQLCEGCHDGSTASEATRMAGLEGSHPVGVPYASDGSRLTPAEALPSEITVVSGRVGCTSCHSPYSSLDALLVMSNRESRLCLSCHEL